jgi:hypothetical protein
MQVQQPNAGHDGRVPRGGEASLANDGEQHRPRRQTIPAAAIPAGSLCSRDGPRFSVHWDRCLIAPVSDPLNSRFDPKKQEHRT